MREHDALTERFGGWACLNAHVNRGLRALYYLVLSLPACLARAEDFKLSDGTVFRHARVVEVRPDVLVLVHDGGMAIATLAKLPKAIRARYGYEPGKAAAFREREMIAREARLAEDRRLVAAHEQRRMELARRRMEASAALGRDPAGDTHFSYGEPAATRSHASAEAHIAAEIEQHEEARVAAARAPETLWTADFWKHPVVQIIGGLLGAGGKGGGGDRSASAPRNWR